MIPLSDDVRKGSEREAVWSFGFHADLLCKVCKACRPSTTVNSAWSADDQGLNVHIHPPPFADLPLAGWSTESLTNCANESLRSP